MEVKTLEEWRLSKFWSQGHLAREAGIDKGIISRVESKKQGCRLETAKKIADALEIAPAQILEFKEILAGKSDRLTMQSNQAAA